MHLLSYHLYLRMRCLFVFQGGGCEGKRFITSTGRSTARRISWWVKRVCVSFDGEMAEAQGRVEKWWLGSQAAFWNPPEETNIVATISSLAPPLQFKQFPSNFPKERNHPMSCSQQLQSGRQLLVHLLQVSGPRTQPLVISSWNPQSSFLNDDMSVFLSKILKLFHHVSNFTTHHCIIPLGLG